MSAFVQADTNDNGPDLNTTDKYICDTIARCFFFQPQASFVLPLWDGKNKNFQRVSISNDSLKLDYQGPLYQAQFRYIPGGACLTIPLKSIDLGRLSASTITIYDSTFNCVVIYTTNNVMENNYVNKKGNNITDNFGEFILLENPNDGYGDMNKRLEKAIRRACMLRGAVNSNNDDPFK